jgi:hypothetical protein
VFEAKSVERYPDVHWTTVSWAVFQGATVACIFLGLVLPDVLLGRVVDWWQASTRLDATAMYGAFATGGGLIAWFLFAKLKVQRIWDRRVSKWRKRHEVEFLLPTLLRPLRHRVDTRFIDQAENEAEEHGESSTVQALFENVIIKAHDKLPHSSVSNYLAALTSYWELRVSELFVTGFVALVLLTSIYAGIAGVEPDYWRESFTVLAVSIIAEASVLAYTGTVRHRVRKNALVLISDMHLRCQEQIVEELVRLQDQVIRSIGERQSAGGVRSGGPYFGSDRIDNDVFYATPMASVTPGKYAFSHAVHMRIVTSIRAKGLSVFWAGELLPTSDTFDDEGLALLANLRVLRRSVCFVLVWPEPTSTSALLELGYFLALNRSGLILVDNVNELPFLVRGITACFPESYRTLRFRSPDDLREVVLADLPSRVEQGRARIRD